METKHIVRQEGSPSGQRDASNVDVCFSEDCRESLGPGFFVLCCICYIINAQPFPIGSRLNAFSIFIWLSRLKLAVHIQVEV